MHIQLLYFAWVKEQLQLSGESFEVPEPALPLSTFLSKYFYPSLSSRPGCDQAFLQKLQSCAFAVDEVYAGPETVLSKDCEVAVIPPVSGG